MIVDAHIHLWRLARGDNVALEPWMGPLLRDHEPQTLRPELDACGIDAVVVVQAAETLAESLFTLGLAARHAWIAGVVGWLDLASPALVEEVAALRATGRLVGVRPVRDDNRTIAWLLDARLDAGLRQLAAVGLPVDLLVQSPDEIPLATYLARRHPELTLVLDHCGKPDIKGGRFEPWAGDLAALAACRNTVCKLSGLPNGAPPGASVETLRPYARRVLDLFGPERVLWASDWPPLRLAADYAAWWAATQALLEGLGPDERAAVLGGTAARIYRLFQQRN
jgi:L-fuconolactonase